MTRLTSQFIKSTKSSSSLHHHNHMKNLFLRNGRSNAAICDLLQLQKDFYQFSASSSGSRSFHSSSKSSPNSFVNISRHPALQQLANYQPSASSLLSNSYHTSPPPAENSFTKIINEMNRLASRGRVEKVLKIWNLLQLILNNEPLENIPELSKNRELSQMMHDIDSEMIESNLIVFYVFLLKAFVNARDLKSAEEAMQKYFQTSYAQIVKPSHYISDLQLQQIRQAEHITPLKPSNSSVYSLMMKLYAQKMDSDSAAKVYQALETDLPHLASVDSLVNNTLLSAFVDSNQHNSAKLFFTLKYKSPWHENSESNTVEPDMATYAIMMKLYSALKEEEELNSIFDTLMTSPKFRQPFQRYDPYKYNIMLAYISQNKSEQELMNFFTKYFKSSLSDKTKRNKVIPTIHTYSTLFKFYSEHQNIVEVQRLFELMVHDREKLFSNDSKLFMDKSAFHVIIDAHLKCGKDRQAREILENFFQTKKNNFNRNLMRPVVSHYNLFLNHYAKRLMQSELEEILTMMEEDGTRPDENSAFAVVACAAKRDIDRGLEEFQRWFYSPMGTPRNARPKRFVPTSRVYELLMVLLLKQKKFDKVEELLSVYDKDKCKRTGSIYRKVFFSYLSNEKLDDAIRVFRTYFISPASHPKAAFRADLQMCNTLLWHIYNQKDVSQYEELVRALRFVRDRLQQKSPQALKKDREGGDAQQQQQLQQQTTDAATAAVESGSEEPVEEQQQQDLEEATVGVESSSQQQ